MDHVLSSPPTPIPGATPLATHESKESTAKDVGEDIIHSWSTPASFPQALFSIAVIKFLLFRVGQHLIGKTDFFELFFGRMENNGNITTAPQINSKLITGRHKKRMSNFN